MNRIFFFFIAATFLALYLYLPESVRAESSEASYEEEYMDEVYVEPIDNSHKLSQYRGLLPQHPDSVINLIISEIDIFKESKETDVASRALYLLGLSYYFNGQYMLSNYFYKLALSLNRDLVSDSILEAVYNNMGVNYDILKLYQLSIFNYSQSSLIAERLENTSGVAQTDLNIAILHYKMGNLEEAIAITTTALDKFEELEDPYHIALASMNLGSYKVFNGDDGGLNFLFRAKELFNAYGYDRNMAHVKYHIASAYLKENTLELSIEYAEAALALLSVSAFSDIKVQTINMLISLYDITGRPQKALGLIEEMTEAISMGHISSMGLLVEFWDISTRIYLKQEMGSEIVQLLDLKDTFEMRMRSEILNPLFKEYLAVKELSPEYAESIEAFFPEFQPVSQREKDLQILILILSVVLISSLGYYLIYWYDESKVTDVKKLDYLLSKIDKDGSYQLNINGSSGAGRSKAKTYDQLFQQIEKYLMENDLYLDKNISREQVSKELFTNVKYVSESIKKNTNLSFTEYINHMRIARALKMLRSGDQEMSMGELCDLCGYTSEATFYRNFKSIVGISPNRFREKIQLGSKPEKSSNRPFRAVLSS